MFIKQRWIDKIDRYMDTTHLGVLERVGEGGEVRHGSNVLLLYNVTSLRQPINRNDITNKNLTRFYEIEVKR